MKKLALALVCFASVAFLASCDPEVQDPQPTIAVMSGENFVTGTVDNPTIINLDDANYVNLKYGFHVESNAQTKKELASLKLAFEEIYEDGTIVGDTTIDLTGLTSYDFSDFLFPQNERVIIGEATIKAIILDVNNQSSTATIAMKSDKTATDLAVEDITWIKTGHNVQDLSAYGLVWKTTNYKTPFTHIIPAEGSTLYLVENGDEDFANIVTDLDLANYYANLTETARPIEDYDKVDCNASASYHDLLIVRDAEDNLHAININHAAITTPTEGTRITITGKAK